MAEQTPSLGDRVQAIIDEIRPYIQMDGGDIELIGVGEDKVVTVRLHGACSHCSASLMTLKGGVEARIREEIPEIVAVEAI